MLDWKKHGMLLGAGAGALLGAVVGAVIGALLATHDAVLVAAMWSGGTMLFGTIVGAIAGNPKRVFGSKNERELKRMWPIVRQINDLEETIGALSNEELRAKTDVFRQRVREETTAEREELERLRESLHRHGEEGAEDIADVREAIREQEKTLYEAEQKVLETLLPEAFACVREVSRRTIGLRHYDVQLLGGMVLHRGRIAEMKTGEGKTLVATLAVYLNALSGRGVHLVTVNDYLARRDVQWMGPIYHGLGLTVASIVHDASFQFDSTYIVQDYRMLNLRPVERKEAYLADITYGTNHEFGFDYLRDNMKFSLDEYAQRELAFAIVDEVDNILIDEARTPLIISGPAEQSTELYYRLDRVVPRLRRGATTRGDVRQEERAAIEAQGDYTVDEKAKTVTLTEAGVAKIERMLGVENLYDPEHIDVLHHVNQALRAHVLFRRDVDYIVKDGQVVIVDEFTGRLMPGRRWSDGLHQAVEAKEGLRIERENQTLATITIQNYFRMYRKLAGMTGTADTEAPEFDSIYKLQVTVVPSNKPLIRQDLPDVVYKTEREKFDAVAEQIRECYERSQPVLVGTISVEKSEHLSKLLKRRGVKHSVLNAVNHEAEANIISQAGRLGSVTIATNMAGRGTDILLGGNAEFLARAEMENEWVSRAATLPEGAHRYEDVLTQLREQYENAIEQARATYEPRWKPLEESQATALEDFADAHRSYLDATFWQARRRYEEAASQVGAETGVETLAACASATEAYSNALREVDRVTGPHFGEEGQQRFERVLQDWLEVLRESANEGTNGKAKLQATRSAFDRVRLDYERAMERVLEDGGPAADEAEAATARFVEAERHYKEVEAAYTAERTPYEEAVAEARRVYEEERRKYTKAIEDVREQMEAAPQEIRERYGEILAKYESLCSQERGQVVGAGGLFIVGTERHESRRIDNQLRGRAGRQGDPGASRFFLSLEDDLLRIFGAERIQGLMTRMGMEEGEPIEHRLISRAIANAQSKVEGHNFDIRKHLLEYDDVMNTQREVIYAQRRDVLSGEGLKEQVADMVEEVIGRLVDEYVLDDVPSAEWEWSAIDDAAFTRFNFRLGLDEETRGSLDRDGFADLLHTRARAAYAERETAFTVPVMRQLEKFILLQSIDVHWKDHLLGMDHLKEGIGLRGYGQLNPLQEYQKEGFAMFEEMITRIQDDAVQKVFTVQLAREADVERLEARRRPAPRQMVMSGGGTATATRSTPVRQDGTKVGRNDPCPCGSGKKYKKCHGA
jgi:preprotein translocase SecA subunit